MSTNPDADDMPEPTAQTAKRTRRGGADQQAHSKKTALVRYEVPPPTLGPSRTAPATAAGFTYRTQAEARKRAAPHRVRKWRRAPTTGPPPITVDQACDEWLAGRRGIRRVTLLQLRDGSETRPALPREPQAPGRSQRADGDGLVRWMLTEARTSPKATTVPTSLAGPGGSRWCPNTLRVSPPPTSLPSCPATCTRPLSALLATGTGLPACGVGVYAPAAPRVPPLPPAISAGIQPADGPVHPDDVRARRSRATSTRVCCRATSLRWVGATEGRRTTGDGAPGLPWTPPRPSPTAKSWTLAEVGQFRESVRGHRFVVACWLLYVLRGCAGPRCSGCVGSAVDLDTGTLSVRRSRVAGGRRGRRGVDPKSRRSRRDLPLPADVTEALRGHCASTSGPRQLALGVGWSDDRLVAVHEDGNTAAPRVLHRPVPTAAVRRGGGCGGSSCTACATRLARLMLDGRSPARTPSPHGWATIRRLLLSIYSDAKAGRAARGGSVFCFR